MRFALDFYKLFIVLLRSALSVIRNSLVPKGIYELCFKVRQIHRASGTFDRSGMIRNTEISAVYTVSLFFLQHFYLSSPFSGFCLVREYKCTATVHVKPLNQSVCVCVCVVLHTGEASVEGLTFVLLCARTYVCAFVHSQSASFVESLMSVTTPVTGSSHMARPRPLPVHQHKGWCGLCHALSQRRNTVGAQPSVFTLTFINGLQVR